MSRILLIRSINSIRSVRTRASSSDEMCSMLFTVRSESKGMLISMGDSEGEGGIGVEEADAFR